VNKAYQIPNLGKYSTNLLRYVDAGMEKRTWSISLAVMSKLKDFTRSQYTVCHVHTVVIS